MNGANLGEFAEKKKDSNTNCFVFNEYYESLVVNSSCCPGRPGRGGGRGCNLFVRSAVLRVAGGSGARGRLRCAGIAAGREMKAKQSKYLKGLQR